MEFDACRTEMELLPIGSQLTEKQREFEKCKEKYEKLKCDVGIKIKFLDENQVREKFLSDAGHFLLFVCLDKSDEKTIASLSQCHCCVFLG